MAPPPWSPLLLLAAGGLLLFAAAEWADGWFIWRNAPDPAWQGFLEHRWHITASLVMAAAALALRAWLGRAQQA